MRQFLPQMAVPLRYWLSVAAIVILGVALRWPALATGFSVDDYAQLAMMRGEYPVSRHPLELFTFSAGDPAEVQQLKDSGFFPWWSHPRLRLSMLRPLPSALMWLDLWLFGDDAFAYHLHGLLWWVLLLVAAALVLRRLLPWPAACLALLLFALDEAHAMVLGWLALRNEIVASLLSLVALGLYLRRVEAPEGVRPRAYPVAAAYALALCGGEYALPFLGYFVAYEWRARAGIRDAARRLSVVMLPALLFVGARVWLGFGSVGSEMYVDPLGEPGHFLRATLLRLPVLAGDLVLAARSDWWGYGFPLAGALVARGASPAWVQGLQPTWNWLWGLGVLSLLLGGLLARAARRCPDVTAGEARDQGCGDWVALGTLLSLVPLLGAYPSSRLLVAPAFGFAVLLAGFAHGSLRKLSRRPVGRPVGPAVARLTVAVVVAGYHVVVPAIHSHNESWGGAQLAAMARRSILAAPLDRRRAAQQDVVLLGAADPTTTIYVPLLRTFHGESAPRSCHLVTATLAPHELRRVDERTLELVRLHPAYTAGDLYGAAFDADGVRAGQVARAGPMVVTVLEAEQGIPVRTRHRFDVPLSDPSLVFLHQRAEGLLPVKLPEVGETLVLPPPALPVRFAGT